MPMPEGSQLNQSVSPMLTNIASNFIPKLDQYVAKQIFPNVPVASPSGTYNIWKQGDFLRRSMKKLANAEAAPVGGFSTGKGTFAVGRYGLATNYTSQDLAEARRGGTSDQFLINNKTRYVTTQAVLELEMQTATLVTTSANWSLNVSGVTANPVAGTSFLQWDQATSQPIDDVLDLKERMRLATGFVPNKMIIPQLVWIKLRKNQQLLSRIIYDGRQNAPANVTLDQLRALFEIDTIIIAGGVYNTANEGATDAFDYIWGKYVWLGYVTATPSMDEPSAGYHFSWVGDTTDGLPQGVPAGQGPNTFGSVLSPEGIFIKHYHTDRPDAMWVESELFTTPNVVAASLGTLMSSVIA